MGAQYVRLATIVARCRDGRLFIAAGASQWNIIAELDC
jgi:hypothetical protein